MQVKTYTNVWNVERKLYNIYDLKLPTPISLRQIGIFTIVAGIWIPFMVVLGLRPTSSIPFILFIAPPVLLAYLGNRPVFEGKSIIQYARSFLGYQLRPHVYTGVYKKNFVAGQIVSGTVWSPLYGDAPGFDGAARFGKRK